MTTTGDLSFDWDQEKADGNEAKHGISFEEAALLTSDPDHSEDEDRFVLLGMSVVSRILVVCHCYREPDEVIRLISARKAGRQEREQYLQRFKP